MRRYSEGMDNDVKSDLGYDMVGQAGNIPIAQAYCDSCRRLNTHAFHEDNAYPKWICIGCGDIKYA